VKGASVENELNLAVAPRNLDDLPEWQLVQRIVASPQFVRAARLKTFLQYVARCALLHHADQVTEQQVGIYVFGRPADYNAGEDNIVRSQARFLRVKLAEYFETPAGREEPIVLVIPKGTYLPQFLPRSAESAPADAAVEPEPPAHPVQPLPAVDPAASLSPAARRSPWPWIALTAVALLATVCLVLFYRPSAAAPASSPGDALWARLFDGHRTTTIVASDYIFSMIQEAAGRPLSLDEYLGADYFDRVAQLNAASGLERLFPNIELRHYTGFENVTSVARLSRLKQAQATPTTVRFARDLTMRDLAAGNVVLLGSKQSNPWVRLFENKLNFRFEYQAAEHNINIRNVAPRPGEQTEYRPSPLDATTRDIYGEMALLPNVNGEASVLILQGTSMAATEACLDIAANGPLFRELLRRVQAGRPGPDLPYFEALIRTRTTSGVAGETSIVAVRVQ
jgi:hypothetical protein